MGVQARVRGIDAIHEWMMSSGKLWGRCAACSVIALRSERLSGQDC